MSSPSPQQPALSEGHVFASRYRIERFLAQGGMGAVYVAEHTATERRVALKLLFPHALASEKARAGFELEARVANRIQSEHIVQVLDAGVDAASGAPFLAMELLTGRDLDRHLDEQGPLPPGEVVEILRQVASALDKAHAHVDRQGALRPIVHRDLKPENLFLTTRESGERCVKILDFGIAKVLGEQMNVSREIRGTPLYMAPEQAGAMSIGPATDIWALGLIAHVLLSGRSYWRAAQQEGASVMSLLGEILTSPLDSPTERLREVGILPRWPAQFDAWFARCVARKPEDRYPSAGEAVRALALCLKTTRPDETLFAPAPPQPPPAGPTAPGVATHGGVAPTLLAPAWEGLPQAGGSGGLSAPALTAGDTASGGALSRSLATAPQPRPARRTWLIAGAAASVVGITGALLSSRPPSDSGHQAAARSVSPSAAPAPHASEQATDAGGAAPPHASQAAHTPRVGSARVANPARSVPSPTRPATPAATDHYDGR